jgi:hypothetical protein
MHDELPRAAMRRVLPSLALAVSAALSVTACHTAADVHAVCPLDTTGVLVGRVEADSGIAGPFVVVAREQASGNVAHRAFIEDTRAFAMLMDVGRYDFFAFSDSDRNGRRSADEPASAVYALRSEIRAADLIELPPLQIDVPAITAER